MLRLMQKDLILCSRLIVTLYIFYGCLGFYFFVRSSDLVPLLLATVMFSFIPIAVVAREDMFKAGAWSCTFPVTRKQIVAARYLLSASLGLAGVFLLALQSVAVNLFLKDSEILFNFRHFLFAAAVPILVLSVVLPVLLRFGLLSLLIVGAGLNIFLVVGILLAEALGSQFRISSGLARLASLVVDFYDYAGDIGFFLVLAILLALIVFLSFQLAQRIYLHRDF